MLGNEQISSRFFSKTVCFGEYTTNCFYKHAETALPETQLTQGIVIKEPYRVDLLPFYCEGDQKYCQATQLILLLSFF